MKESKQKVSDDIRQSIARCLERIQLEGENALILPEQFAALIYLRQWLESQGYTKEMSIESHALSEDEIEWIRGCFEQYKTGYCNNLIIKGLALIKEKNALQEIWNLAGLVCQRYGVYSTEDVSRLSGVMEYMLEAIQRAGNKEYFFTPPAVAELMIGLLKPERGNLWDPACGSGTFLCKAEEYLREQESRTEGIRLSGTELNGRIAKAAGINLLFHGMTVDRIEESDTETGRNMTGSFYEDTIRLEIGDAFEREEQFDYIVANPPVSAANTAINTERGHIVPTKALHLQFLQHIMKNLKKDGQAAVLVNESLLFSERSAERRIREALVERHGLKSVISLPQKAFAPYTNAKSSILLFGGEGQAASEMLFYDMEFLGYSLDKNRYAQEENDIPDVLQKEAQREELYRYWRTAVEWDNTYNPDGVRVPEDWQERKVWFADIDQIRENNYILLPGRYQPGQQETEPDTEEPEELLKKLFSMELEIQEYLEGISRSIYEK